MRLVGVCLLAGLMTLLQTRHGEGKDLRKRMLEGKLMTAEGMKKVNFLVSLRYVGPMFYTDLTGFEHLCGGTLVTSEWIVTAGHCFSETSYPGLSNKQNWTVVAGEYDLNRTDDHEQIREIVQIELHPQYIMKECSVSTMNHTIGCPFHDAALLKVHPPFEMNEYVGTLSYDSSCVPTRSCCALYGWGSLTEYGGASQFPYKGVMMTMGYSECNETMEEYTTEILDDTMMCAVGHTQDGEFVASGCSGDSGGPLVCYCDGEYRLTGIFSGVIECGNPENPNVFTRIGDPSILDFIESHINPDGKKETVPSSW